MPRAKSPSKPRKPSAKNTPGSPRRVPNGSNPYSRKPRTRPDISEQIRQLMINGLAKIEGSMLEGYLMRMESGWITVSETSILLNQSPQTTLSLIRKGEIEASFRTYNYLVRAASIKDYLERHVCIAPSRAGRPVAA